MTSDAESMSVLANRLAVVLCATPERGRENRARPRPSFENVPNIQDTSRKEHEKRDRT